MIKKAFIIITLFVSTFSFAQTDTTPDSWEDKNNVTTTDQKVEINNNLLMLNDGKIGINTLTPTTPLEIAGKSWPLYTPSNGFKISGRFNNYAVHINNSFNSVYGGGLLIETANANSGSDGGTVVDAIKVVTQVENHATEPHRMLRIPNTAHIDGNTVLLAEDGGNVGIGTSYPQNELDVCGYIRAQEIIVEDGWCDYVFDHDYPLPSLKQQAQFISENKHLKNFKSEENMLGQIELADITIRQQQTIEELMLYIIEMDKRLLKLEEANASLKNN